MRNGLLLPHRTTCFNLLDCLEVVPQQCAAVAERGEVDEESVWLFLSNGETVDLKTRSFEIHKLR